MADKAKLNELARGFRKRTLVTARLASKVGMKYVGRTLSKGKGSDKELSDAARQRALQGAEALVEELGALKGLVMKVGQMVSYLPGTLSPEAQSVLSQLQASSTAMTWDVVHRVLVDELGADPAEFFDELDEEPFAAASIGQVHRAKVNGVPVAVKVQYPGIEDVLASDVKTLGFITNMGTLGLPVDGKQLIEELSSRMAEECDYTQEAENQRFFAQLLVTRLRTSCHNIGSLI